MKSTYQPSRQLDARDLILDADFESLSVSESTMLELARQWTEQVSLWLGLKPQT